LSVGLYRYTPQCELCPQFAHVGASSSSIWLFSVVANLQHLRFEPHVASANASRLVALPQAASPYKYSHA